MRQAARAAGGGGVRPHRAHPEQRDDEVDRARQLGTSTGTVQVPQTVRAAQVTSVWDHPTGSREDERGCKRRGGQPRPADVAPGVLQVL